MLENKYSTRYFSPVINVLISYRFSKTPWKWQVFMKHPVVLLED